MDNDATLHRLLRSQHGAVTTRQLTALGFTPRQVELRVKRWHSVARGVHVASSPTFLTAVWAGLLAGGEHAVVGLEAAGYLAGYLPNEPRRIVVWVRHPRRDFTVGSWRVVFRQGERVGRGTPRRTRPEDTVLDIASTSSEVDAVGALTRALTDGHTTAQKLNDALRARSRQRHRRVLQQLCSQALHGIESALEWLFHRDVVIPHGLPIPIRQESRSAGRVDNLYAEYATIVELDGTAYHRDKLHDYFRDNEHLLSHDSWTLRYGWAHVVHEPCVVAAQVARALQLRGWLPEAAPPRCACT